MVGVSGAIVRGSGSELKASTRHRFLHLIHHRRRLLHLLGRQRGARRRHAELAALFLHPEQQLGRIRVGLAHGQDAGPLALVAQVQHLRQGGSHRNLPLAWVAPGRSQRGVKLHVAVSGAQAPLAPVPTGNGPVDASVFASVYVGDAPEPPPWRLQGTLMYWAIEVGAG